MDGVWLSLLYAGLAGAMIPAGAILARIEHIRPSWLETEVRHSVIAFGGGVLLAAVAFVLAPEGAERLSPGWAAAAFLAGAVLFAALYRAVRRWGGPGPQLIAMMADFVPEAAALGAMAAGGSPVAGLLALLIGLQNLPEGFNAWREMIGEHGTGPGRAARFSGFIGLALMGPAAAALGHLVLAEIQGALGAMMLMAAGGIVYLVFRDIAAEAHLENREGPALAAAAGFGLGFLGHLLVA